MVTRKVLASLAAAGLVFGSTAASAAPARTASPTTQAESMAGGGWAWMLAVLIVVGVIGVIAADSDETAPKSP